MGDLAAMHSIEQIIAKHGDDLTTEAEARIQPFFQALGVPLARIQVVFRNEMTYLNLFVVALGETGEAIQREAVDAEIMIATFDIDELAEMFPDCDVGY